MQKWTCAGRLPHGEAQLSAQSRRCGAGEKVARNILLQSVPEVYENVTDPSQYELLEMNRISGFVDRARGTGRPTKKERRALDAFIEEDDAFLDGDGFDF